MLFFYILSSISFIGVIYLFIKYNKKNDVEKDPQKEFEGIYLKPIPARIESSDVDPNYELLLDVINTAKIESWKSKIEIDFFMSRVYQVEIESPNKDIKIICRVRMEEMYIKKIKKSIPIITGFHIFAGPNSGAISYNSEDAKTITLDFVWNNHIIPYHEKENSESLSIYTDLKKDIENKLVSLKRKRGLDKIFEE
jgi:hypothetical protein